MFDLKTSLRRRYAFAHLKNDAGEAPALVLRQATSAEWLDWRREEMLRAQRQRRQHLARLKALGWTEVTFAEHQDAHAAHMERSTAHMEQLEALHQREVAGADVSAERADAERRFNEEILPAFDATAQELQRYNDLVSAEESERAQDVEHTLRLVLTCATDLEGVTSGGERVVWSALDDPTRRQVLDTLLGPGHTGLAALYQLATLVVQGLTDQQKKA